MSSENVTLNDESSCPLRVCDEGVLPLFQGGDGGLMLPLFGYSEQKWPKELRAVIYLLGLFWAFMGVGMVSDRFMDAIEKVTSKKKRVFSANLGTFITVKVWNATVANLTLMALGSSAPEILLSIIELLANDFYSGDLGPSTIVGSAAFNLFIISAVCVSAIPGGELRKIADLQVFGVTGFFSIFAYIWLIIIVQVWTPDVINIEEGIITFLLFPVLVGIAFAADKGWFSKRQDDESEKILLDAASEQELAAVRMQVLKKHGTVSEEEMLELIQAEFGQKEEPSRAARRAAATEKLFGGRKKVETKVTPIDAIADKQDTHKSSVAYSFENSNVSCLESCGALAITVKRESSDGLPLGKGSVQYKTVEETAKGGEDFIAKDGVLDFDEGEEAKLIKILIIDDDALEDDEYFAVELFKPVASDSSVDATLGDANICRVRIVDDDAIGEFCFCKAEEKIEEDSSHDKIVSIGVQRVGGSKGKVSCTYRTEDGSAKAGLDYDSAEGKLEFEDGQMSSQIDLVIKPRGRYEATELFRLYLENAEGGASFSKHTDGGEECCICTILIESDAKAKDRTDKLMKALRMNWDNQGIGRSNWKEQFLDAVYIDPEDATGFGLAMCYFSHILAMPWKLLFAFIPPTDYCGGWLCFFVSLTMIGIVTAFIGDIASLAGCVIGIPDAITAITLVALGTSLPDTFASKTAAEQDETADASIGNVTGSNAVNVFLGLGMPWTIGAIYWAARGELEDGDPWFVKYQGQSIVDTYPRGGVFVVLGGSLGFSVMVFCIFAVVCISVLMLRRATVGGELGGPQGPMYATSGLLASLWFGYIALSIWKVLEEASPCDLR
eukprot:TRINITY_DN2994_c0_g2_i1.p1 TRINITY_DN2994_c0_g2~~TRINITY_DN2994_c0_g2_i1.p1  ORF type:complete len:839 (+),score=157.62 TRINITY_DN2994_c0_g2_i1:75-2591(+)